MTFPKTSSSSRFLIDTEITYSVLTWCTYSNMNYALFAYELHISVHFQILKETSTKFNFHFTAAQDTQLTSIQSLWQYIWRKSKTHLILSITFGVKVVWEISTDKPCCHVFSWFAIPCLTTFNSSLQLLFIQMFKTDIRHNILPYLLLSFQEKYAFWKLHGYMWVSS